MAFTQTQLDKIVSGEGIVVLNLGVTDSEKILGPCRGGAEIQITPTVHDIEFDGRKGKTKGLQVKDEENAVLKVKTLDCAQEVLLLALNNATLATKTITQNTTKLIASTCYQTNVAIVSKTLDGKFKVLKLFNPMHEGAFDYKVTSKNENEHNLEFYAHYDPLDDTKPLYEISEVDTNPIA